MRAGFVAFGVLLAAVGAAQPTSRRVVTLDVALGQARRVVVGRISRIVPRRDSGGYPLAPRVEFTVEETLKGEPTPTISIVVYRPERELERALAEGHRFLVYQGSAEDEGPGDDLGALDLADARTWAVTADGEFLRSRAAILAGARAAIRRAGDRPSRPVLVAAPSEGFRRTYARLSGDGYPIAGVVVPADARLERRARRELVAPSSDLRLLGLRHIEPFPAEANRRLVRALLRDRTRVRAEDPVYHWGIEVWNFPVRRAALGRLSSWGEAAPKPPVVEQRYDRTETLRELIVSDPRSEMPVARLATLPRFRRLETLTMMIYRVTDAHLALLARARTVTTLDVSVWSEITDAGLEALVGMPRLRDLRLGTAKITDAGLPTLARIASLRRLDVRGTGVTPDGLAAFRRARPDVEATGPTMR